eukprot:m.167522 g.167522  ORF g.167522 m.167522 type:complete len:605 (-) comp16640_c0_seq2:2077-3891(-)
MADKPPSSAKRSTGDAVKDEHPSEPGSNDSKRSKLDFNHLDITAATTADLVIDSEPLLNEDEIQSDQAAISSLLTTAMSTTQTNDIHSAINPADISARSTPTHRKRNRRRKRGRGKKTTPSAATTAHEKTNREIDVEDAEAIDPVTIRSEACLSRRPHTVKVIKPQRPVRLVYLYGNYDRSNSRRQVAHGQSFFKHEASATPPSLPASRVQEIKDGLIATDANRMDPRLALLKPDWLEYSKVLDVGCNTGQLVCDIARLFNPTLVRGLDIDATLVKLARRRLQAHVSRCAGYFPDVFPRTHGDLQVLPQDPTATLPGITQSDAAVGEVAQQQADKLNQFYDEIASIRGSRRPTPRVSAPTSPRSHTSAVTLPFRPSALSGSLSALTRIAQQHAPTARSSRASSLASPDSTQGQRASSRLGPVREDRDDDNVPLPVALTAAVPATSRSFPRNVLFEEGNAVELTGTPETYGVILCLNVIKYVQLTHGDASVERLLQTMVELLQPGGILVLQLQGWSSYTRDRDTTTLYKYYARRINLRPSMIALHVVGLGLELIEEHTVWESRQRHGRAWQVFQKPSVTPGHSPEPSAMPPAESGVKTATSTNDL